MSDWDDDIWNEEELNSLVASTNINKGGKEEFDLDDWEEEEIERLVSTKVDCKTGGVNLGWDDWDDDDLGDLAIDVTKNKKVNATSNEMDPISIEDLLSLTTKTKLSNIKTADLGWDDWDDEELVALVTSPTKPKTNVIECDWNGEEANSLVTTNTFPNNILASNRLLTHQNNLNLKLPKKTYKPTNQGDLHNKVSATKTDTQDLIGQVDLDMFLDSDDLDEFDTDALDSIINEMNFAPPKSNLTHFTSTNISATKPDATNHVLLNEPGWSDLKRTPTTLSVSSNRKTTFHQKTIHSYMHLNQIKRPYIPPDDYYERNHEHLPLRYDSEAVENWIYPTNYPIRDYQFNIVHRALFENTLVSLPTGLGKTFIAAVVMFNFYKWFPKHKVIFTAPTRPLVSQQIEACFKICGIRLADSTELTGEDPPISRVELWEKKRIFYLTPQILNNDLKRGLIKPTDISCVVFDEAHRAQGAYAYVSVTNELYKHNPLVRTLALSATPGRSIELVQSVVNNLRISRIESRSEESPDIKQYTFEKLIDKVVLEPSTMLEEISTQFKSLILPCIKSLYSRKYIWTEDLNSISSFTLILARETFRSRGLEGWEAGVAQAHFALSISFVRKLELLTRYGFTSFLGSIHQWREESKLNDSKYRKRMLENPIFNGIVQRVEMFIADPSYLQEFKSHPKLEYLVGYLKHFFNFKEGDSFDKQSQSKVMIFANFRGTVDEIKNTLLSLQPVVRPMSFIGQSNSLSGKGLAQKDQLQVISKFKNGEYNVLICTSIGEEGLDIGEVDLIVCYDCQSSPIRMLQRIGRTGRRRQGRVLSLLTKGSEERSFYRSKELHAMVLKGLTSGEIELFPDNPRIIPEGITPTCLKTNIVSPSQHFIESNFPIPRSNASIALTSEEVYRFNNMFGPAIPIYPSLGHIAHQTRPSVVSLVPHGRRTNMLIEIVKMIGTKGFNNDLYSRLLQQKEINATKNVSIPICSSKRKIYLEPEEDSLHNTFNSANVVSQTITSKKSNAGCNNIGAGLKKYSHIMPASPNNQIPSKI